MPRAEETEESGPIQNGIWDTRTRENSRWCQYCKKWLRLETFLRLGSIEKALEYHQQQYCKASPTYDPYKE